MVQFYAYFITIIGPRHPPPPPPFAPSSRPLGAATDTQKGLLRRGSGMLFPEQKPDSLNPPPSELATCPLWETVSEVSLTFAF